MTGKDASREMNNGWTASVNRMTDRAICYAMPCSSKAQAGIRYCKVII
jgi:hypothetical protein